MPGVCYIDTCAIVVTTWYLIANICFIYIDQWYLTKDPGGFNNALSSFIYACICIACGVLFMAAAIKRKPSPKLALPLATVLGTTILALACYCTILAAANSWSFGFFAAWLLVLCVYFYLVIRFYQELKQRYEIEQQQLPGTIYGVVHESYPAQYTFFDDIPSSNVPEDQREGVESASVPPPAYSEVDPINKLAEL